MLLNKRLPKIMPNANIGPHCTTTTVPVTLPFNTFYNSLSWVYIAFWNFIPFSVGFVRDESFHSLLIVRVTAVAGIEVQN